MSEYQRYEFMTSDRPLTSEQLAAVNKLSSHIEASSTHAVIEYNWGDFKHDPLKVLRQYFDGFLYWANWGSPRFALRFPHGALPADFIESYDFDDIVTFTRYPDYDILDIHFGEMEAPDEWTEYALGPLMAIRDELLEGDRRALYIAWLAVQSTLGYEGEDEEDEEEEDEDKSEREEEDETRGAPMIPPGLKKLTKAQEALVGLLRVPEEVVIAAAQYSESAPSVPPDDFTAWVELLPQDRRSEYLARLARNEPGLSRQLVKELRDLGRDKAKATPAKGVYVTYSKIATEIKDIRSRLAQEALERQRRDHRQHLQDVQAHQDTYWHNVNMAAVRGSGSGYEEATKLLIELREAAFAFNTMPIFQARFQAWIQSHLRRPSFLTRLRDQDFTWS